MDWNAIPTDKVIQETAEAVRKRGLEVLIVSDQAQALEKVKSLIPAGALVMTGSSTTLDEIGFHPYLYSGKHPYKSFRDLIFAEKDEKKKYDLRRQSMIVDYYLGSVQAIARTGEILSADASGSRVGPYAYGSLHVVLVAGVNKIVNSLEDGLRRIREHCVPLEDQRMKKAGFAGTTLSNILVVERTITPGRIALVLVKEKLGF